MIIGSCASSPSRKNPKTVSPGDTLRDLPRLALPEPAWGDSSTCAQGRSLFGNSVSFGGWYPKILTFNLHPQADPDCFNWSPWASSGATCPIHQRNPSLPIKLVFIKLFSIIFYLPYL